MATSAQLTEHIIEQPNPKEAKQKLWDMGRYLVAQRASSDDFLETNIQYFRGRRVIPGVNANPRLSTLDDVHDLEVVERELYIRFTDAETTANADAHIGQALFTLMTNVEADEYEKVALGIVDKINNVAGNKRANRKTTK